MNQEFSSDTVQLATRIPKSLHIRMRVTALDEGVTVAEWVKGALVEHLERCRGGKKRRGPKAATDEG